MQIQLRPLDSIRSPCCTVSAIWLFNLCTANPVAALILFPGRKAVLLLLLPKLLDLLRQPLVLPYLPLEKELCRPGFFLYTRGCQVIEIGAFTAGFSEILHLHKPPLDQGVDEEIDLAEADPQPGGKFTLGHLGRFVDLPEDPEHLLVFELIGGRADILFSIPFIP
jgi:hypothetical protein